MSKRIRRRAFVSGMVQGVNFRYYTRSAARQIGVTGWVRNLSDGRVEAVIEGEPEPVEAMLAWLRKGSPGSRVESVTVHEETATGEFADFDIQLGGGAWW